MAEQYTADGQTDFLGGQDASKHPSKLPPNCYYAGVNIQITDGIPKPRWGFNRKKLTFGDEGITLTGSNRFVTYESIFHSGRYQCAFRYSIGADNYILIVVSGIIFLINVDTFQVTVSPIQDGSTLNENTPRLSWSPAGAFTVIFDFPNLPVILDGVTARRADPALYEVPISTLGAYNQNRLFIANAGNEYTAGDPTGNTATPNAPITFEEIEAPAAAFFGQIFALPTDRIEPITAMCTLPLIDTSTGIGPLLIGTANAIYSVNSNIPRTDWESSTFASAFTLNAGIAGARSFVTVNSDLFFTSSDGQVRSASMSRDEQRKWSRVPLSREVQNWLIMNDKNLVSYTVMGYFKNKIFIAANPFRVRAFSLNQTPIYDVTFGGMVVLGTDNVATLGQTGQPAWEALWTGVRPMDFVNFDDKFFIISKDSQSRNELYEVTPGVTYDTAGDNIRYADSIIYTREHNFNSPFQLKDAHSLDLNLSNVQGDLTVKAEYRPSHAYNYALWQEFKYCAPWRQCDLVQYPNGLAPHNFQNFTFGSPREACAETNGSAYTTFKKLQLRLSISGKYWELQDYTIKALARPQNEQITMCTTNNCVQSPAQCNNLDWAIGPFVSCLHHRT